MIITLTGANNFLLRQRLRELTNAFVAKHGELALERFDGEEAEAARIIESINALPFLSTHKMIIVRNGSANKDLTEQVEQIVSSTSDSVDLIFYEPNLDKRTVYFKVLKKQTQFEEFDQLNRHSLAKWLLDEAKKQGAKLALADANYLVERVGDNQEMLFNELTKLAIYNSEISKENIDLLTEPTPQSKVFDLLDAAFAGQKSKALKLYEDQRAQKVEPQAILAMIAWQLQLLALVKLGKGQPTGQIAKDAGMNPYPVNKAAGLARNLSDDKLRAMVSEALDIDIKSKTTSLDLDEALKTYITTTL